MKIDYILICSFLHFLLSNIFHKIHVLYSQAVTASDSVAQNEQVGARVNLRVVDHMHMGLAIMNLPKAVHIMYTNSLRIERLHIDIDVFRKEQHRANSS